MIYPPSPFTRFGSRIIGLPELLSSTALIPLEETPVQNEEGWDTLTINYVTKRPSLSIEELAALFPLGTRLGSRNWWVIGSKPSCVAQGIWKAEVTFQGWAAAKPVKITVGAAAEQQSAENTTITGVGTFAKVSVSENMPTMRVTYLLGNWADAPTNQVGRTRTPPDPVAVPASFWDYLTTFTYNYPNDWVLMACNLDRIPGATAALVSEDYKFIRAITP